MADQFRARAANGTFPSHRRNADEAKATRTSVLPEYCDPLESSSEDEMGQRDPSRVRIEVHHGEPDWATEWFGRQLRLG